MWDGIERRFTPRYTIHRRRKTDFVEKEEDPIYVPVPIPTVFDDSPSIDIPTITAPDPTPEFGGFGGGESGGGGASGNWDAPSDTSSCDTSSTDSSSCDTSSSSSDS